MSTELSIKASDSFKQPQEDLGSIYQLFYIQHTKGVHVQVTQFRTPLKDFRDIVQRARKFCDVVRYRYVNVKPFMIDLDAEERRHTQLEDPYTG